MPTLSPAQLEELRRELKQAEDLTTSGITAAAEKVYRSLLSRFPGHPVALQGLGLLKHSQGNHEEALRLLREAAARAAGAVEIRCNLAAVLGQLGRHSEAAGELRQAVGLKPDYPDGWRNLGVALERCRKFDDAIAAYRRALALNPDDALSWAFLGNACRQLKMWTEAARAYHRSIDLGNGSAQVRYCFGIVLQSLKLHDEALAQLRLAVSLRPGYSRARSRMARSLGRAGRYVEAAAVLRTGMELDPANLEFQSHLAFVAGELGELDEAISCFRTQLAANPQAADARSSLLYTLHYHAMSTPEMLYQEHLEWGKRHVNPDAVLQNVHGNDRDPNRRLRIGYVSPDFREHTVPRFISPVIKNHDRDQFEIYCYSNSDREDSVKARLKQWASHWREIRSLTDDEADRLIRGDKIDILIDLRGHAADNRLLLFARKPAPVQALMVGYFDTTGLPTMDYRITDEQQDPTGVSDRYHVEKLARLPESSWCYAADDDAPSIAELPALGNGYVTFGSLNKIIKLTPECARLWAQVLRTVGDSKLMLVLPGPDSQRAVRERLAGFGLPSDRVILVEKAPTRSAYLDRYRNVDIVLDTFPFPGITTTCDGLWMGVPVVTMAGATSVSRAGRSIVSATGLIKLAATTEAEYVTVAASLAHDIPALTELRAAMRERMRNSPLMSHIEFTRRLESTFRDMWRQWASGAPGAPPPVVAEVAVRRRGVKPLH